MKMKNQAEQRKQIRDEMRGIFFFGPLPKIEA